MKILVAFVIGLSGVAVIYTGLYILSPIAAMVAGGAHAVMIARSMLREDPRKIAEVD